jgi:RNA polymerase sigma factor (sigma-70 family)
MEKQSGQMKTTQRNPVQLLIHDEELERASFAIAELPFEQREVVVLHLQGNMRFRQIAKMRNVSIKTIQSRYRYGLNKLRSLLNGDPQPSRHFASLNEAAGGNAGAGVRK